MEDYHKDRIIIRMSGIFLLNFFIPFFFERQDWIFGILVLFFDLEITTTISSAHSHLESEDGTLESKASISTWTDLSQPVFEEIGNIKFHNGRRTFPSCVC